MISREWLGYEGPPRVVTVELGQMRLFAKAIGERNPIHFDSDAARKAGLKAPLALPTFGFCLNSLADGGRAVEMYDKMGVMRSRILHGEQHFEFLAPIYAGDVLTFRTRVTDIYEKKGGALGFIVTTTRGDDGSDQPVVRMRTVTVVRNGAAS